MHPGVDVLEFGPFVACVRDGTLLYKGAPVILTAKSFDTLIALLRSGGAMMTKAELMQQVWPDLFVEESNLVQNISMVRRALAIDPDGRTYIETVPKRGYRLTVEVRLRAPEPQSVLQPPPLPEPPRSPEPPPPEPTASPDPPQSRETPQSPEPPSNQPPSPEPSRVTQPRRIRPRHILAFATLLVLIAAVASTPLLRRSRSRPIVAVLGFQNLSADPAFAWYGRALAELLPTELDADSKVHTIPAEEIASLRADLALPDQIGYSAATLQRVHQRTGSEYVITGSCLPVNGSIRVDIRIQNTTTAETVAALSLTGTEARLADLAAAAGAGIRAKLGLPRLSASDEALARSSLPANREAQQLYAEGLDRLRAFDALQAQPLLTRAVQAAPEFPLTHMQLSLAWSKLGFDAQALREAKAAFELAANLPRPERLEVEGRYRMAAGEWSRATDLYRSLWTFYPDQPEYGIALAQAQKAGDKAVSAAATIAQLRQHPAGAKDPAVSAAAGEIAIARGEYAHAVAEFEDAAHKARQQNARLLEGHARARQAEAFHLSGAPEKAAAAWRDAEAICTAAGDSGCVAEALNSGAEAARVHDDRGAARALVVRALAIERKNGDRGRLVRSLNTLGLLERTENNPAAARAALTEALQFAREIQAANLTALILTRLGDLDRRSGNDARARKQYQEGAALTRDAEGPHPRAVTLDNEARTLAQDGDLAGARRRYEEALAIKRTSASPVSLRLTLGLLARVMEMQGDLKGARKLRLEHCDSGRATNAAIAIRACDFDLAQLALLEGDAQAALKALVPLGENASGATQIAGTFRVTATANLALGHTAEARTAIAKAIEACGAGSNAPALECGRVAITAARVECAEGRFDAAAGTIGSALEGLERQHVAAYILEARLVKAQIAWRAKDPSAALQSASVARDADRMGFRPIAVEARHLSAKP